MTVDRLTAWQDIRALRAQPPGLAAREQDRRAVFSAALAQAQELAEAAASTGYATRPLPLFYSLSQGLRAVAAARIADDAWRISGHGASVLAKAPLLETRVRPKPKASHKSRDALTALQTVLGAKAMTKATTLGQVWQATPDSPVLPDGLTNSPGVLVLHMPVLRKEEEHAAEGRIELAVEGLDARLSDSEIQAALRSYPTLAGARSIVPPTTDPARASEYRFDLPQARFLPGRLRLSYHAWTDHSPAFWWPLRKGETYQDAYERLAPTPINGEGRVRMTFPPVGGVDATEFMVLWWVICLALSSLVRYEPSEWIAAVDPATSKLAVPLEQMSDFAERFVPHALQMMLGPDFD